MGTRPVTLDFSTAIPEKDNGPVTLDFSTAQMEPESKSLPAAPAPREGFHPLDWLAQKGANAIPHMSREDMKKLPKELQEYDTIREHPELSRNLLNLSGGVVSKLAGIPAGIVDFVTATPKSSIAAMNERAKSGTPYDPKKKITGEDMADYATDTVSGVAAAYVAGEVGGALLKSLGKISGPSAETRAGKLAFAAGKDTTAPIEATLKDLQETAERTKTNPSTVGGFLDLVNTTKDALGKVFKDTLGPAANRTFDASPIADHIENLITPNMANTVEGKAQIRAIYAAAREFRQPWTLGELDAERMKRYADLGTYHNKTPVGRYSARMGSINLSIDEAVNKAIRENIYPVMDQAAGKPTGYFNALQAKRANLIRLQNALDKQVASLHDTAARAKAAPRMSRAEVVSGMATGHAPSIVRTVTNAIHTTDVENVANRAVKKGLAPRRFSAPVMSLPAKSLLIGIGATNSRNASDAWSDPNQ